jgi:hypothetical protein
MFGLLAANKHLLTCCWLPLLPLSSLTVLLFLRQPASGGPAAVLAGAGPLNVRGSMNGSHLAPTTRVDWASPSSGLSGSASFTPTALSVASTGPGFKLRASAVTSNPTAEKARAADTQVGPLPGSAMPMLVGAASHIV